MAKNMTMPYSFVVDVYALLTALEGVYISDDITARCRALQVEINAKLERMEKREAFTAYKVAPRGSEEREERRREYLDKAGLHRDWRTEKETPF